MSSTVPPFRAGGEFTVGVEEELLLVEPDGSPADVERCPDPATLQPVTDAAGAVTGEIFVGEVELNTAVGAHAGEVVECLDLLRRRLARAGLTAMAVGVHPESPLGRPVTRRSARYDRVAAEFAGLFRTPTAALQVHVGLPDSRAAVTAYRGLRNQLCVLRALAADSPFWHGRDSGLASTRAALMRSYPRVGIPPVVTSYDEYVEVVSRQMAAAEVPDYTYLWWDLRLQPRLGTLEVRVMDAQPSLERTAALVALVQGLARHAVEHPADVDLPTDVLSENDFRASRYGMDARVVDLGGAIRPVRQLAGEALERARAALAADGSGSPLVLLASQLADLPEPARQRRLCAEQGMPALLADLTVRTMGGAR